jgi:hypothetical protein
MADTDTYPKRAIINGDETDEATTIEKLVPLGYKRTRHTNFPIVDDPMDEVMIPGTIVPEHDMDIYF